MSAGLCTCRVILVFNGGVAGEEMRFFLHNTTHTNQRPRRRNRRLSGDLCPRPLT